MVLGFSIRKASKMRIETGCQIWQPTGSWWCYWKPHYRGGGSRCQTAEVWKGRSREDLQPECWPEGSAAALHGRKELQASVSCHNQIKRILTNIFSASTSNLDFFCVCVFLFLGAGSLSQSQCWPWTPCVLKADLEFPPPLLLPKNWGY